jgi:N-acylneuraminate cytidylyltransferase
MVEVVQHALRTLAEDGRDYDLVCLLQPTSPARPDGLVDRCVGLLTAGEHECVMTVVPVAPEHHPDWAWVDDGRGGVVLATGGLQPVARRQDLRAAFRRDGAVYVSRPAAVLAGSLYGASVGIVETDPELAVSIDVEADWARAEAALRRRDG